MKGYIFSPQLALFGHKDVLGFGDDAFFVKEVARTVVNRMIIKNHYSGKIVNNSYIHLGVFIDNNLIGCLQYGYAMHPNSGANIVPGTGNKEYLELNRMWLDDCAPRNSESKAISYSIKYIKKKFPQVKWIQSFADDRCQKKGIVYQAANFIYCGSHQSIFLELDGEFFHRSVRTNSQKQFRGYNLLNATENQDKLKEHTITQFRYIFFIDKRLEKSLSLQQYSYEKHYDTKDGSE